MIAACPKCDAKYRVDAAKVGPGGARLRCAKCQAVFRIRAPQVAAPAAVSPEPVPATMPAASPAAPSFDMPSPPAAAQTVGMDLGAPGAEAASLDRERLVLLADPREETAKRFVGVLSSWGLQVILVHDGVEAMLAVQRSLPRVVVLDAALPKMYGFQICEIIKRNESLRDIKVVLIGAIHQQDRYRRPPTDLYGADAYLEQPDLPDGLASVFQRFGLPVRGGALTSQPVGSPAGVAPVMDRAEPASMPPASPPVVEAPAPAPSPPPSPAPAPAAVVSPAPAVQQPVDGLIEEREKAARLARIIVSDIVLYQGEKFDTAIQMGTVIESLDSEIEEGRNFFRQRISEEIRNEKDYLMEELMRVARERGMQ